MASERRCGGEAYRSSMDNLKALVTELCEEAVSDVEVLVTEDRAPGFERRYQQCYGFIIAAAPSVNLANGLLGNMKYELKNIEQEYENRNH